MLFDDLETAEDKAKYHNGVIITIDGYPELVRDFWLRNDKGLPFLVKIESPITSGPASFWQGPGPA